MVKVKCPNCQAPLLANDKFPADAIVCEKCGKSFPLPEKELSIIRDKNKSTEPRLNPMKVSGGCILSSLLIAMGLLVFYSMNSSWKTSRAYSRITQDENLFSLFDKANNSITDIYFLCVFAFFVFLAFALLGGLSYLHVRNLQQKAEEQLATLKQILDELRK